MRDADEQNAADREEQNFEGNNSGQHRRCIVVERPWGGGRSGTFWKSSRLTKELYHVCVATRLKT